MLIAGVFALVMGVVQVVGYNSWTFDYRGLITLLGWVALLKGDDSLRGGDEPLESPPARIKPGVRGSWRDRVLDLPAVPTTDPSWLLVEEGFTLAREHEVESRFTVANGYVGTRGSLAEGTRLSAPGTYVAGVFDVAPHPNGIPELVLAPDWTRLTIIVEGNELTLEAGEAQEHRRVLDLRQGMHWRRVAAPRPERASDPAPLPAPCLLADRHALVQSLVITPENYSATLRVEAASSSRCATRPGQGPSDQAWSRAGHNGGPRLGWRVGRTRLAHRGNARGHRDRRGQPAAGGRRRRCPGDGRDR